METNQKEFVARLRFDDKGLIPVIVQDAVTHRVLMMAYMNREALELSLTHCETYFWSRSRQALWHKGETSGNRQKILKVESDCDSDTLLVSVQPMGPACHTGAQSCFYTNIAGETQEALSSVTSSSSAQDFHTTIERLVQVIKSRKVEMPEGSYTAYLFSKGIDKILKKIGEESAETIIAAKNKAKPELAMESADLLYHLLVLFVNEGLELEEVLEELERRANKGMAREE
jgi:phosphoribosyl-AMP cyclohydrolase / phosphoribosyl-ATP pyrophosphohydrolase